MKTDNTTTLKNENLEVVTDGNNSALVDKTAEIKAGDTAYSIDIGFYLVEEEDVEHANENHWKVIKEPPTTLTERTQGVWDFKQSRGNNEYEYKVFVKNRKTICEMEADSYEDIGTTKANAAFICKAVNNYEDLVTALHNAIVTLETINDVHKTNYGLQTITQGKETIKKATA